MLNKMNRIALIYFRRIQSNYSCILTIQIQPFDCPIYNLDSYQTAHHLMWLMSHRINHKVCFQNSRNTHRGKISRIARTNPVIHSSLSYIANILLLLQTLTTHKYNDMQRTAGKNLGLSSLKVMYPYTYWTRSFEDSTQWHK